MCYAHFFQLIKTATEKLAIPTHVCHCRYEVLQCGDIDQLIKKRKTPDERPVYYVSIEDTYDIIKRAHIATGHGGRDRMTKHLTDKYANITRDALKLFKSFCAVCQEKKQASSCQRSRRSPHSKQ